MITGKPEHLKTFDYLGLYRYFLTFCTHERRRLFENADAVLSARTQIERAALEQRFALIAYCFMPDHVHLLIEGQAEDSDGRCFIARAKRYSGFHNRARFGERLWQWYGFERTLRDDEATVSVARYIFENPLKAGLVERIADYPFLGSNAYTIDQILEAVQLPDDWRRRSG